jgi:hypothetical protein
MKAITRHNGLMLIMLLAISDCKHIGCDGNTEPFSAKLLLLRFKCFKEKLDLRLRPIAIAESSLS